MEKAILKATNRKCVEPKAKHVQTLIAASWSDIDARDILRPLSTRLHDSSWVTVFKTLIVVHRLLRDGCSERLYNQLSVQPGLLNVSGFRDKSGTHEQTKNIKSYAAYIEEKVLVFRETHKDFVQGKNGENSSLRKLTIGQGLLKETKFLQRQISTLLNCKFYLDEVNNEVTLEAYRLLIKDLLKLFQCMNEAAINILEHYFEMEKVDARNSLEVYRTFTQLTEKVLEYLSTARRIEGAIDINIPNLKHAPVSLALTLEEYLNNPDFESNRRQYLESKQIPQQKLDLPKNIGSIASKPIVHSEPVATSSQPPIQSQPMASVSAPKPGPEKELIDFFASIEEDQSMSNGNGNGNGNMVISQFGTMNQYNHNPYQTLSAQTFNQPPQLQIASPQYQNSFQPNQFQQPPQPQIAPSSPSNPFQRLPQFTSQTVRSSTNPFSTQTGLAPSSNLTRSATNPFAKMAAQTNPNPNGLAWNLFNQGTPQLNQQQQQQPQPHPNQINPVMNNGMNNGFQHPPPNQMQLYGNAFGNA